MDDVLMDLLADLLPVLVPIIGTILFQTGMLVWIISQVKTEIKQLREAVADLSESYEGHDDELSEIRERLAKVEQRCEDIQRSGE